MEVLPLALALATMMLPMQTLPLAVAMTRCLRPKLLQVSGWHGPTAMSVPVLAHAQTSMGLSNARRALNRTAAVSSRVVVSHGRGRRLQARLAAPQPILSTEASATPYVTVHTGLHVLGDGSEVACSLHV